MSGIWHEAADVRVAFSDDTCLWTQLDANLWMTNAA